MTRKTPLDELAEAVANTRASVRHNLANLFKFGGRDTSVLFWPYALIVVSIAIVIFTLVAQSFAADWTRAIIAYAKEHPDRTSMIVGSGVRIRVSGIPEGIEPMLAAMSKFSLACLFGVVLMLAASVTRRLRDVGRSVLSALVPVVLLALVYAIWPIIFTSKDPFPVLFFIGFFAMLGAIISSIILVVRLVGDSTMPQGQVKDS